MDTEVDYITDNFLNRARLGLLGLNRVSEGELLSMEPFSTPLYELVYIAAVTGVEEYLYHRLSKEVFENEGSIQKYIDIYNIFLEDEKNLSSPSTLYPSQIGYETIAEQIVVTINNTVLKK